jgi:hypothetical protein
MKTRKDLREEAEHLPASLDDLIGLHDRVVELGISRQVADGLCMWVLAKQRGAADNTGSDTRARYRKILAQLNELEPIGPARRKSRRSSSGDAGLAELKRVGRVGVVAGMAAAAATGHWELVVLLTPGIPDAESYVESPVELAEAA